VSGSEYLISELRRVRESMGLTQESWGERVHFSAKHVGSIERGERPALPNYLGMVDKVFGTAFMKFYREFVIGEHAPVWLKPFVDYEARATLLRVFHPFVVPGLLQTEAYAREVLRIFDEPASDLDALVQARIARQSILTKDSPIRLVAVVDELVFHREVVSREVMREQVDALVSACELPNVQVHVIPLGTGLYAGLHGGLVLATVEGRTVGFLDGYLRGRIIEAPYDTAKLEDAWESTRGHALPYQQSLDLIKRMAEKWT